MGHKLKILVALILAAAGVGTWTWWNQNAMEREIAQLQKAIENLSAMYPIARLVVTEQTTAPDGATQSQIRVIFVDEEGRQRGETAETRLPGERIYFEALMIKFDTPLVQQGEARALAFPTRVFTEKLAPEEGFKLDILDADGVPVIYESEAEDVPLPAAKYRDVLKRFWYFANHPEEAADYGISVLEGKAVFSQYEVGRYYLVIASATGDLTIQPEKFWIKDQPES